MSNFKKLKNKILNKITLSDDYREITFHLSDEKVSLIAYEECCEKSWIEYFESPTEPCKIIKFTQIEIPSSYEIKQTNKNIESQEYNEYYLYKVITDRGDYLIEIRSTRDGCYFGCS